TARNHGIPIWTSRNSPMRPHPQHLHALLWDSRVLCSRVVRETPRILKALEQEELHGREHVKSQVVRHRRLHDPGIPHAPPCLGHDLAPTLASQRGRSRVVGAPTIHSAGKESSVSSTIRKTVGKSGMKTIRQASKAV